MTIMKCHECGKDVSDQAEKCPACGAPVPKEIVVEPPRKGFVSSGERPRDPGKLLSELYAEGQEDADLLPPPDDFPPKPTARFAAPAT